MAEFSRSFPYDPLPASSSSSDAGIREEDGKGSNLNLVSSSTLNDKAMSLCSFPVESEIFTEKSPLTIQTFQNDSFTRSAEHKRKMGISNFILTIQSCCLKSDLAMSSFRYEIDPVGVNLSRYSTIISDISRVEKDLESRGTDSMEKHLFFRIQNVSAVTIANSMILSTQTFCQEILPTDKHVDSSQNLKKLGEQMMSLQSVFEKVRISREFNHFTTKQEKRGFVEIKQVIENIGTQTGSTRAQNTDFSCEKVEHLILECEFIRAAINMIKKCPFYYEFLEKCYSEKTFYHYEKLKYLKPKEKNLKEAVIHAHRCNENILEAINSLLLVYCNVEENDQFLT